MQRNLFKLYLGNTAWLFAERALQLTLAFVVNLFVARYLQPSNFGLFNYALSIVALASPLAALGVDAILIRELVRNPTAQRKWLGTGFALKLTAGVGMFLIIALIQFLFGRNPILNTMVLLMAAGLILQSMNVIDDYFQSQVASRYTVQAKMAALLFSSTLKVLLILGKASLVAFAALICAENIFLSLALWVNYRRLRLPSFIGSFDRQAAKWLLQQSWPLLLTSLSVAVYLKIDQVLLKRLLDAEAVGHYAAAVRISEALYFIPIALTSTFYPTIIAAKEYGASLYQQRLQRFYDIMVWLGLILAVFVALVAPRFVPFLYGASYEPAAAVLRWHGWALWFVFMANAGSRWFLLENRQLTFLWVNLSGAVANVLLNLWLIPIFGIRGAALATVVSYAVAGWFGYAVYPYARANFGLMWQSINIINAMKRMVEYFRISPPNTKKKQAT